MFDYEDACRIRGLVDAPPRGKPARIDLARPEIARNRRKVRVVKHGAKAWRHIPILAASNWRARI
jgi:hypothetical protein